MIYPQKLSSRKGQKILNISLIVSIIIAIILIIINKIINPNIHWAALANCGIIYIWITVIYSIKRSTNIGGHVLLQTIAISMAALYIDDRIGFKGWSINIAIPIMLIIANTTMLILTIVGYKKYIKYAIYQLIIVLMSVITIIVIMNNMIEVTVLSKVSIGICIANLVITLILCYRDMKDTIIRNLHM